MFNLTLNLYWSKYSSGTSKVESHSLFLFVGDKRKIEEEILSFADFYVYINSWTSQDIGGNDVSLSEYKGKTLLIVNVASKW